MLDFPFLDIFPRLLSRLFSRLLSRLFSPLFVTADNLWIQASFVSRRKHGGIQTFVFFVGEGEITLILIAAVFFVSRQQCYVHVKAAILSPRRIKSFVFMILHGQPRSGNVENEFKRA